MVCPYCSGSTQVLNSRPQKRLNQIWRRRKCSACGAIVTTLESIDTYQALRLSRKMHLEHFSRDTLLLSIYDSLKHRPRAQEEATALTSTLLGMIYSLSNNAVIERDVLVGLVGETLERFDIAAATHYRAFHPSNTR